MKRTLTIVMMLLLIISACSGCGAAPSSAPQAQDPSQTDSQPPEPSQTEPAVPAQPSWAEENGLYIDESPDELYKRALEQEGGKVVIYTASSRHAKVKEAFEKEYPGMELIAYNISTGELVEKLRTEYESGLRTADIVQSKEVNGEYVREFFSKGILHNYQPASIYGDVDAEFTRNVTPFFVELSAWFYNDAAYPDGAPIDSWWDIIRPEWSGKVIFQDPTSSPSYMTLLAMLTHDDVAAQLAASYKDEFGEDIVLADDEPNAGYAWIKRFLKTDYTLASSADETVEAVGTTAGTDLVGYSASSKIREREGSMPYLQADMANFAPALGVYGLNFLSIVNEAEHPNGAKLYIRYVMGGEDGKGEGFNPFNTLGAFPVRPETPVVEGSLPLSDIPLFECDYDYVFENMTKVSDYWLVNR